MIADPLNGGTKEELRSPVDGMVFTLREYPVVNEGSLIARILGGIAVKQKKTEEALDRGADKNAAGNGKKRGGAGK